jgi:hypothetical protein
MRYAVRNAVQKRWRKSSPFSVPVLIKAAQPAAMNPVLIVEAADAAAEVDAAIIIINFSHLKTCCYAGRIQTRFFPL